jgi:flagellar basal body rod protein FlgF
MSDLSSSSIYRSPLDDLIGSPLIQSKTEALADQLIYKKGLTNKTFDETLKDFTQSNSPKQVTAANLPGCHPLSAINCDPKKAIEASRENTQNEIQTSIDNILNADKPGYHRVLPFKDANGNPIIDDSKTSLKKTNWQLDLAVDGQGEGFKLTNGQYTRDGRFKYNAEGRPVTVNEEVPLEICYKDGAPVDWSLKSLQIDFEGTVTDKQTGQELGKLEADLGPNARVMQNYLERSNVNLPVEFMGLAQKLRLIDLTNGISSTGTKLDKEAIDVVRAIQ